MAVSCLDLLFNPEYGGLASPSKRRLTFTGLNGIMSRKEGLFEVEEIYHLYASLNINVVFYGMGPVVYLTTRYILRASLQNNGSETQ
jgi:hypothetical protein